MVSLLLSGELQGRRGDYQLKEKNLSWSRHVDISKSELNQNCQKIILYSFLTGM